MKEGTDLQRHAQQFCDPWSRASKRSKRSAQDPWSQASKRSAQEAREEVGFITCTLSSGNKSFIHGPNIVTCGQRSVWQNLRKKNSLFCRESALRQFPVKITAALKPGFTFISSAFSSPLSLSPPVLSCLKYCWCVARIQLCTLGIFMFFFAYLTRYLYVGNQDSPHNLLSCTYSRCFHLEIQEQTVQNINCRAYNRHITGI